MLAESNGNVTPDCEGLPARRLIDRCRASDAPVLLALGVPVSALLSSEDSGDEREPAGGASFLAAVMEAAAS